MAKKRNPFPGVGNTPAVDRHGVKRWRLRKTINGRKIDVYLPGSYGSAEFRIAYEAAVNPAPTAPKTAGAFGTFDHVITTYRGNKKFLNLADTTRYAKGKRLDAIRGMIGPAHLSELLPYQIEVMMDRKGGPDAANRLAKEISEIFNFARKKLGLDLRDPTIGIDHRKTREGGFHSWTKEQVEQYRAFHPSGTMPRMALELMLATGAARQDACRLGPLNIKGDAIYYRRGKTGQAAELELAYMGDFIAEIVQLPPGADTFITYNEGQRYTSESFGNWFAEQCDAAGLPSVCRAHGLRKRGAVVLAEGGATVLQIMAFLGHKTPREATRYFEAANRKKMAGAGMALVYERKVSNLADWLGKSTAQTTVKQG